MVFRQDDLRRETSITDGDGSPDPVFVKNLQEDRIKQGVGGGKSGPSLGFVWKRGPYSARIRGCLKLGKRWSGMRVFSDGGQWFSADGVLVGMG